MLQASRPPWVIVQSGDSLLTSELASEFLESKRKAGRAEKTLQIYEYALRKFAEFSPELPLTPDVLEEWLSSWKNVSDATVADYLRPVVNFYRWLVRRGVVARWENPTDIMERPRVRRKLPKFLTPVELRRVVRFSRAPYQRALILLLSDCGPRIGELKALTKDNIVGECLLLNSGKTGERMVPVSPTVLEYLRNLPTHYLFPSMKGIVAPGEHRVVQDIPLTTSGMMQQVERTMRRAGIKPPKLGPHRLRHTFATQFIDNGGDVVILSRILGHTSVAMASRYVGTSLKTLQEHHAKYSPWNSVAGMMPATLPASRPRIDLPVAIEDIPLVLDGENVFLSFVQSVRRTHVYYYLQGRTKNNRWHIASLGADLSLELVDGYRLAVEDENRRRYSDGVSQETVS